MGAGKNYGVNETKILINQMLTPQTQTTPHRSASALKFNELRMQQFAFS